jgi:hypothetical protein
MYRALLIATILFVMATPVSAAVRINEVAWMGNDGTGGGSCEWIELYNSGDDIVDLTGWSLLITNPGSSKELFLGGTEDAQFSGIASRGYYFIARETSSCIHAVAAEFIDWLGSFGNGISNEGATLTLKQGGTTADLLQGTAGWKESGIGGSNTSPKKTPQYTEQGWHEAAPTPRSANVPKTEPELEDPEPEQGTTTPVVTVGGTAPLVPVPHPIPELHLALVPNRIVSVGAHTPYSAVVYDNTGKIRNDAQVTWSFGDGGREQGRTVRYAYQEPGDYTVAVRATAKGISTISLISVTAAEAAIAIQENNEKGVILQNKSDRIVDLSAWKLRTDKRTFALPEDTVLLPGKSALFPSAITRLATSTVVSLHFPNGKITTSLEPALFAEKPI